MKRLLLGVVAVVALGVSANVASAQWGSFYGGYPSYGYQSYGYTTPYGYQYQYRYNYGSPYGGYGYAPSGYGGYPAYGYGYSHRPGGAYISPRTGGAFGGSPNNGNYQYWLSQQASQGRMSWAEVNRRTYGN